MEAVQLKRTPVGQNMNHLLLATLMLILGVGSLIAQETATGSIPTFKAGARVRAQISVPNVDETEWFTGIVASSVEGCGLLVMNDVPSRYVARDGTVLVTFQSIVALQLSSLYDGHIDPENFRQRNYTPDKSLEGEEWIDVPVDSLKATDPVECRKR